MLVPHKPVSLSLCPLPLERGGERRASAAASGPGPHHRGACGARPALPRPRLPSRRPGCAPLSSPGTECRNGTSAALSLYGMYRRGWRWLCAPERLSAGGRGDAPRARGFVVREEPVAAEWCRGPADLQIRLSDHRSHKLTRHGLLSA